MLKGKNDISSELLYHQYTMKIFSTAQYLNTIITEKEMIEWIILDFDFKTMNVLYQYLVSIEGNLYDILNNSDRTLNNIKWSSSERRLN